MNCPLCHSDNVSIQAVAETELQTKHRSIVWWICIGWWWLPLKWLIFTIPALIVKLFRPKRYKTRTIHKNKAICQQCGNSWFV